jgi:hypothetical protein
MKRNAMFFLAGTLLAAGPAAGQVSLTLGVDPVSHYVWRGADLLDGGVGALQPWAAIDLGDTGLSVGLWSSFGLLDRSNGSFPRSELDEFDISLDFARDVGEFALGAGLIHYSFIGVEGYPDRGSTTHEIYLGAGLNSLPFAPMLTGYYDFNLGDGFYLSLAGEQELPVGIPLNLQLSAGYMDQPGYRPEAGISDLNVALALPLALGSLEVTPLAAFTHAPSSGEYLDAKSTFWGGLSISTTAIPLLR